MKTHIVNIFGRADDPAFLHKQLLSAGPNDSWRMVGQYEWEGEEDERPDGAVFDEAGIRQKRNTTITTPFGTFVLLEREKRMWHKDENGEDVPEFAFFVEGVSQAVFEEEQNEEFADRCHQPIERMIEMARKMWSSPTLPLVNKLQTIERLRFMEK